MKTHDELKALVIQRGVHPEFGDAGEGWGIEQNPHELATFLVRMTELGVVSVLEIGTGYKGGLSRFLAADMGWLVTSIDINPYHHAFERVHYIVSQNRALLNEPFDLVFIDGNHHYDSVKADYEHYAKYAIKVIAFHDVAGLRECEGVQRFWLDSYWIPESRRNIIATEKQSGIGWIEL